ncbi:MAG: sulfatase-like hydrolase/transferase [Flavobacteriaceae bacterium]
MKNKIFLKALVRIGFWFPILLSIIIYKSALDVFILFGDILLSFTIILCCSLFRHKKINSFLEITGVILFNIIMFIQITHFYLFNDHIKSSTIFIIFDSNSSETFEFLSMYFDFNVTLILTLLVIVASTSIFLMIKNVKSRKSLRYTFLYVLVVLILLSNYKIRESTFPHAIYRAVKKYQYDKEKFNEITCDKFGGNFSEVKHTDGTDEEVYVLIIGESTTRTHMQLYGYDRKNNPKLDSLKEELTIYNDIISPHTHTIPSLEKVLTLASHESPNKKYDGTLIQLFNKAGFKTYWLSNQKPLGIVETLTTIISNNCDEQIFVNTSDISLDEKILSPLKNILKQKARKKFIVIHLMGTHGAYNKRYPVSFQKFDKNPTTKFMHEKAYETINTYDNAILYNDFIVSKIIEEVKLTRSKSYALYFSDHGEDVYETMNMACHTETKGSKPMYDIPFILWSSEKFKLDNHKFIFDTNRKYSTENLLYTLSDLSSITFKEFDATKSVVNKNFIPKNRFILNHIDYDVFFNHKKK